MADENKIRDAADAVKGIAEAVPVYPDVIQPAAREIGAALQTIAKSVHIALAPVSALVWGYEKIKDYLNETLTEKLKNVPAERIVRPKLTIAGPTVEALRFAAHEPSLREMYATLLATSMDAKTAHDAHPAFVEIIRQLTPDEARLMSLFATARQFALLTVRARSKEGHAKHQTLHYFSNQAKEGHTGNTLLRHFSLLGYEAGCKYPESTQTYIDNLGRLGLIAIPDKIHCSQHELYEQLTNHPAVKAAVAKIPYLYPDCEPEFTPEGLWLTSLGKQFCTACISRADIANTALT